MPRSETVLVVYPFVSVIILPILTADTNPSRTTLECEIQADAVC